MNRKWLIVTFSIVRALACLATGLVSSGFWDLLGFRFIASVMHHGMSPAVWSIIASYFFKSGKMGYANSMMTVAAIIGSAGSALSIFINLEVG